jgi:hypothetical protein
MHRREFLEVSALAAAGLVVGQPLGAATGDRRFLHVATPGIRNYVEYGGVGILVYAIDEGHRLVRRIPTFEVPAGESPENVKGVAASATTRRLYLATPKRVASSISPQGRRSGRANTRAAATGSPLHRTAGSSTCRRSRDRTGTS